jgi:hypothetical protein
LVAHDPRPEAKALAKVLGVLVEFQFAATCWGAPREPTVVIVVSKTPLWPPCSVPEKVMLGTTELAGVFVKLIWNPAEPLE